MNVLSAVWHAIPAWGWGSFGLVAVVLIAAIALGFWPIIRGLISTVVGLVPWDKWQTWAVIVVVVGGSIATFSFNVWLDLHDQKIKDAAATHEKAAVAARDTYWKGVQKEADDAYAHKLAALQVWIDGEKAAGDERARALEAQAASERAKRQRAEDALAKGRDENVTAEADRLCTLTRGVILQFNAGAADANGGDELEIVAARDPGGLPVNGAAGVALHSYSGAAEGTQRALRACRDQVLGWQRYHTEVIEPWIATAIQAVQSCSPTQRSSP